MLERTENKRPFLRPGQNDIKDIEERRCTDACLLAKSALGSPRPASPGSRALNPAAVFPVGWGWGWGWVGGAVWGGGVRSGVRCAVRPGPAARRRASCVLRTAQVCFLVIFLVMWAGMLILGLGSYISGDPTALSYGTDYQGNRCGVGAFATKPVVWYPRMSADLVEQSALIAKHPTELVLYGLCLEACPTLHTPPYVADYGWPSHPGAKQPQWPGTRTLTLTLTLALALTLTPTLTLALALTLALTLNSGAEHLQRTQPLPAADELQQEREQLLRVPQVHAG